MLSSSLARFPWITSGVLLQIADEGRTGDVHDMAPRKLVTYNRRAPVKNKLQQLEGALQQLEGDAYKAVMRAFNAQADDLTFDRQLLMTELRKELRVSDALHREFLSKVTQDKSVQEIRRLRNSQAQMQSQTDRKRKNASGVLKMHPSREKKAKIATTVKAEEPELSTLEALQREVGLLEVELDSNRLARAKKAVLEYKSKVLEALQQYEQDNDDDSEKTEDRIPDPAAANVHPRSPSQENMNTDNTDNTECKPGHEDG